MCRYFSIDDLFTAGLGLDLAGAILLGFGLLVSPSDIARRSATYLGYSAAEALSLARSRFDAISGLSSIAVGFPCQAAAYAAILGGVNVSRSGWRTPAGAVIAALVAALFVVLLWLSVKRLAVKRQLVEVARTDASTGTRTFAPSLDRLVNFAQELGNPLTPNVRRYLKKESGASPDEARAFVERVFGIDNAATDEELAAEACSSIQADGA
jgi:hypothetical protein